MLLTLMVPPGERAVISCSAVSCARVVRFWSLLRIGMNPGLLTNRSALVIAGTVMVALLELDITSNAKFVTRNCNPLAST